LRRQETRPSGGACQRLTEPPAPIPTTGFGWSVPAVDALRADQYCRNNARAVIVYSAEPVAR
jgi:hypothetical protein